MLDLLNKIASMEFPRIQKQNEKLVCKIAPNRETSLKLPGMKCPRPFSAIDTPLCPRFMPRPWAFFRKLKAISYMILGASRVLWG